MRRTLMLGATITIVTSLILATSHRLAASQERLAKPEALDTIRALNTVEVTELMQHKAFVPLGLAIQNLKWKNDLAVKHLSIQAESSSATVKDYLLTIVISSDAKNYMIQLTPTSAAPDCAVGWFSDPSGVIYSGPSLECTK